MKLLSHNKGVDHGNCRQDRSPRNTVEQGQVARQKPPLKLKEIWAIRIRLQLANRTRELALFNLAIDSKLRGCDLVGLRVHDVVQGTRVAPRAIVMQEKTQRARCNLRSPSKCGTRSTRGRGRPSEAGAVPLSEPRYGVAPSFDPAVFADRRVRGGVDWARPGGLRHPFNATHESNADLPADQKSPGRPTSPWS